MEFYDFDDFHDSPADLYFFLFGFLDSKIKLHDFHNVHDYRL